MTLRRTALALVLALLATFLAASAAAKPVGTRVSVYATGLFNPKGAVFGADGALFVAESGPPGNVTVPLPVNFGGSGPVGRTARVSRIPSGGGRREDFVTNLPSIGLYGGVEMLGAASVTMLDGQLYEVAAGHISVSPALNRVSPSGELTKIADIGKWNDDHPPPPGNGDAVPKGNPFDMVAWQGKLWISDGNYNEVLKVDPATGKIDLVYREDDPVTVGMTVGPDGIYIAQYGPAPYLPGTARIDKITSDGKVHRGVVKGLQTAIDVAFGRDGTMYVLEYAQRFSAKKLRYIEYTGQLLRIGKDGSKHTIVRDMTFPTSVIAGRDGALYVSHYGNEANHGEGQILRVVPGATAVAAPHVPPPTVKGSYDIPQNNRIVKGASKTAKRITIVEPGDVQKWGYTPSTLTVQVGDKVAFFNEGKIAHTATASNGAFDTGLIHHNETAVVTMAKPGTFAYFCQPHPWMKGTIIVKGSAAAGGGQSSGGGGGVSAPSLSIVAVVLVIGTIIAGVFGLAWLARKKPEAEPPPPVAGPTGSGE